RRSGARRRAIRGRSLATIPGTEFIGPDLRRDGTVLRGRAPVPSRSDRAREGGTRRDSPLRRGTQQSGVALRGRWAGRYGREAASSGAGDTYPFTTGGR